MAASLARAALNVFAAHRAVGLKEREDRQQAESDRRRRAQEIIDRAYHEGLAIAFLTPNDIMEGFRRARPVYLAAQAEADLVAGDLFRSDEAERAEKITADVQKRKVRRADLYQQQKRARREFH
jgi:hypothetical protein